MILGYGKMGKEIESILLQRNHTIAAIVETTEEIGNYSPDEVDVAIDFTQPEAALPNIKACAEAHIPIVVGTTGWYSQKEDAVRRVNQNQSALFYASNFSIGVHLFFQVNRYLASLMNSHPYSVSMSETHHIHKKDAPSGTAITTLEHIADMHSQYESWQLVDTLKEPTKANHIPIKAIRLDDVPGTHEVRWESDVDQIQIIHTAHNRKGFALGAVIAAEWLYGKKGIFTMDDMLKTTLT